MGCVRGDGTAKGDWGERYGSVVLPGVARQPLIFLDVDGVLIPFRGRPTRRDRPATGFAAGADGRDGLGSPLLDRLDLDDGRRLLALDGQLVWATTWLAEANEIISPRPGVPPLSGSPVMPADWLDVHGVENL
jgi:hypothetical protein